MNRKQILVILWIVLVLGGLSGISYHRQKYFEDHLENNITELTKDMEERSFELEERWESLDKSDPGKISHYFESEALFCYNPYLIDFHRYLQNRKNSSLLLGTFTTQAEEGALLEGTLLIRSAVSRPELWIWYPGGECHEIFLHYVQQYEDKHTFTWGEFIKSEEYKQFLNEFYYFIENKEEISLQEAYQEIKDISKLDNLHMYRKALLDSYIYLAETSYNNYQVHKNQDEFMKSFMDAEVVYSVYRFTRNLETKEIVITTLTPFRRGIIYIHSSILDIVGVLTFSTALVIVIWFLLKKLR